MGCFSEHEDSYKNLQKWGWKAEFQEVHSLIQEVDTRFGTAKDVTERFMKSFVKVGDHCKQRQKGDIGSISC